MADVLQLFSSNIRPLYEQDILNLLGAPVGLIYRFRYKASYVESAALERWDGRLGDVPVLVQYSLQQPNRYHDAVFFPVRTGTVRRSFIQGDGLCVVEFSVGRSVALREPSGGAAVDYAAVVQEWRRYLIESGVTLPYEASSSLGPDVLADPAAPIEVATNDKRDAALFERNTKYLSGVASLSTARFFRVLGIFERAEWIKDGAHEAVALDAKSGAFPLQSGKAYVLSLLHSQPTEVTTTERFVINADDDVVRIIGDRSFDVASRYDVIAVPVHAIQLETDVVREGVIRISPAQPTKGPDVVIPVRNEQGGARTAAILGSSIAGLVLLGLPAILTTAEPQIRIALLAVGVVIAVFGPVLLRGRLSIAK